MLFDSNFGLKLTLKFNRTMKKLLLSAIALAAFTFTATAQDDAANGGQTSEGKWLIEANTGFGAGHPAGTAIYFESEDGNTSFNLGLEGGYFIMDDLAIKAGLGFGSFKADGADESISNFSYKIGAKYYVSGMIPVQIDFNGSSLKDAEENPSYVGLQGGYAIFLGNNVSIEPGLRYDMSLNDDFFESVFQVNIGFALHF